MITTIQLAPAVNQRAAVLRQLIMNNGVSEQDLGMNGFRMRLTELKRTPGLSIHTTQKDFVNRFGRKSKVNVHFLLDCDKEKAIEVYNRINRK